MPLIFSASAVSKGRFDSGDAVGRAAGVLPEEKSIQGIRCHGWERRCRRNRMKTTGKNTVGNNRVLLALLQLMILGFSLLNSMAHHLGLLAGVKIFLYQFFAWFLAGYAVLLLSRIRTRTLAERVALSYGFGSTLSMLIYFLFMIPGWKAALPYATLTEGLAASVYVWKKESGRKETEPESGGMLLCLALLFIYLLLFTFAGSFVNSMPDETGGTGYYVDWPFWAGNNIGFTKAFPGTRFRQVGVPFAYHYFSSLLMAQTSLCTGVEINAVSFYFSGIFGGILLIFSAGFFGTRVLRNRWLVLVFMLAVLFTNGNYTTFTWHILICPFGYDYGYAYGMLTLGALAEILLRKRNREYLWVSCVFLAMCTGAKGPVAALVLVCCGVATLYLLIRKEIKTGLLCGFLWLLSFLAIYYIFIMYHEPGRTLASRIEYIGGLDVNTVTSSSVWLPGVMGELQYGYRIAGHSRILGLISILLYVYRSNKVVALLIGIGFIRILRDLFRKKGDALLYALEASCAVGILLAIYLTQKGGSQMYFMMGMYPMGAMAGLYALDNWFAEEKEKVPQGGNRFAHGALFAVVCLLGMSVSSYSETVIPKFREGFATIRSKLTAADYSMDFWFYADREDYEAFVWLKENTPEMTVFAMDSFENAYGAETPMMAGVFSGRYVWNEQKYVRLAEAEARNRIMDGLDADPEGTLQTLRENGVSYLLSRVKEGKEEYGSRTDLLREEFRNGHYIIYRLREKD